MRRHWPKVMRDPVHGMIPFEDNDCDRLLLRLIDTKEFQRLRRIKQLGMCELVFPGANHSRFAHCVGVMHLARKIIDRTYQLTGLRIRKDQRTAVLVAALLHDVGHGPFSHAFEKVTGEDHEKRTLEIIADKRTEISKCLRKHEKELPNCLAIFFDEDIDASKQVKAEIPEYLTQIVSSQLDADRFDYLIRDSFATGTEYGRFDLEWLLLQLLVDTKHKRFFLSRKAMSAVEAYIFARYHMYKSIYFHKAVRAAEVMVRLLFRRYRELLVKASTKTKRRAIVMDAPPAVLDGFSGKLSLANYLALDDHAMSEFFRTCASAKDKILQMLGQGLIDRKLYKGIDATEADAAQIGKFVTSCSAMVRKDLKIDPQYAFVDDTAADTPYKPYDPDETRPASQIYIETAEGANVEVSTRSDALAQLRKKYSLIRYYFPESVQKKIEKAYISTIGKEVH